MNGAESLLKTLEAGGVDTCFANPGTSEMHLVEAFDRVAGIRPILCLHETVASGAADGYGRMKRKPAMTILHLGPGLANASSNLHNAGKANTPVINIIGDHATYHRKNNPPLQSDIEGLAKVFSHWVRTCEDPVELAGLGREAIGAAMTPPGRIASLIVPADVSWGDAGALPEIDKIQSFEQSVGERRIGEIAAVLKGGGRAAILMNGRAVADEKCLEAAGRIAAHCGAGLFTDTFSPRMARGRGRAVIERLPYLNDAAAAQLKGLTRLILVGSKPPVSFFAYQGKPVLLAPEDCSIHILSEPHEDPLGALEGLASLLNAPYGIEKVYEGKSPDLPSGEMSMEKVGAAIAALMPVNAIVSDESNTSGPHIFKAAEFATAHDWLFLTGGSIGQCLPLGAGASAACPGCKVICLESDGSAMYSIQALWTMARENLDVTTVIFSNRKYAILNIEFMRMGFKSQGKKAKELFDLSRPDLDFVSLARGMGVTGARASTASEFVDLFGNAMEKRGPDLIEVIL